MLSVLREHVPRNVICDQKAAKDGYGRIIPTFGDGCDYEGNEGNCLIFCAGRPGKLAD